MSLFDETFAQGLVYGFPTTFETILKLLGSIKLESGKPRYMISWRTPGCTEDEDGDGNGDGDDDDYVMRTTFDDDDDVCDDGR